ncbi:MAG: 50S ribosomal protein L35 [Planctomycetes bacterium]|nr:50S ribosomal protein L35 [Planctomycetota bacterium]
MPKMKTRKTVAKRIKVTASGKFKRHVCGRGHLLSNKSGKAIRNGRKSTLVPKAFEKQVRRLLGM